MRELSTHKGRHRSSREVLVGGSNGAVQVPQGHHAVLLPVQDQRLRHVHRKWLAVACACLSACSVVQRHSDTLSLV